MSIEEIKRAITRAQELKYHTVNKALDIMHEEFPNLAALGLLNDVISIDELIARLKFKLNELEKKASMENRQKKSDCRRHR